MLKPKGTERRNEDDGDMLISMMVSLTTGKSFEKANGWRGKIFPENKLDKNVIQSQRMIEREKKPTEANTQKQKQGKRKPNEKNNNNPKTHQQQQQ